MRFVIIPALRFIPVNPGDIGYGATEAQDFASEPLDFFSKLRYVPFRRRFPNESAYDTQDDCSEDQIQRIVAIGQQEPLNDPVLLYDIP